MKPVIIIAILAVGAVLGVLLASSQDIENRSMQPKSDELFNQYASYVDHRGKFLSAWINEEITDQEYMQELKQLEIKLVALKDDYFETDVTDFIKEIRQEIESIEILQMTEDAAISEQNVSVQDTQNNCDLSYPDVCIAPYPPDLDCDEIYYSNFRVTGTDPHGFDTDYDGIGCEVGSPDSSNTVDTTPSCDPSYPDVCIPPYPPDLNCGDIGYSNFRVIGDDPHGFDRDNDGIGCES